MISAMLGVTAVFMAILLSRPITTFVHELGHALPSLWFTRGPVVIYVGSYGDTSRSLQWRLGRLQVLFKFNLTEWQMGLCRHDAATTIWQSVVIVLGGPVFSLLLGLVFVGLLQIFQSNQYYAFGIGIFLVAGFLDFIANIIPDQRPLELHDGTTTYNDGAQFLQILKTIRYPDSYFEALQHFNEKDYRKSIVALIDTVETGVYDLPVYRLLLHLYELERAPAEAIRFYEKYSDRFRLASSDHLTLGKLYQQQNLPLKAIGQYSKAIEKNYMNREALALRGNLFLKLGYEERGKADLQKAQLMGREKH